MGAEFSACPCGATEPESLRGSLFLGTPRSARTLLDLSGLRTPNASICAGEEIVLEYCGGCATRVLADVEEIDDAATLYSCATDDEVPCGGRVVVTRHRARELTSDSFCMLPDILARTPPASRRSLGGVSSPARGMNRSLASFCTLENCSQSRTEPVSEHQPRVRFLLQEGRRLPPELKDCRTDSCGSVLCDRWDVMDADGLQALSAGSALFVFGCSTGSNLSDQEQGLLNHIFGLPFVDSPVHMSRREEVAGNIFIISKAVFVVPSLPVSALSTELISSVRYQNSVNMSTMRASPCEERDCFTLVKTVIPYVLTDRTTYRLIECPAHDLQQLPPLADGIHIDRAFVAVDGSGQEGHHTISVQMYHALGPVGVVYWNTTVIVRSSLPALAARMVDKLGNTVAGEVADSAQLKRRFWDAERTRQA